MHVRYHRRSKPVVLGRTGIKAHANVSKTGASITLRKGPVTFNTRRGFSLNLGSLVKGLSIRS